MYRYTAARVIRQKPEVVMAYVSDPTRQPEWVHGCTECHWVEPGPRPGAVAEQTMTFMGRAQVATVTMTDYQPGRRVSYEKESPFPIRFAFEVEAHGTDATLLRYPVEMSPSRLMRLPIALMGRRINRGDLGRIAARVEAGATTRGQASNR